MLKLRALSWSLGLPLVFVAGSFAPLRQGPAAPDLSTVLGIVDMDRVARAHPKSAIYLKEIKDEETRLKAKLEEQKSNLQALSNKVQTYEEGTSDWIEADATCAGEVARVERWAKRQQTILERMRVERLGEISDSINAQVEKLALQRGLQIVLHVRHPEANVPVGQKLEVQQLNDVIYHLPKLDLTEDVIKLLK